MITAVDSSVLLLILKRQKGWQSWRDCLTQAAKEGALVACPVVFAECSPGYAGWENALEDFDRLQIRYDPVSPDTAWLAGSIFLQYRRQGGPRTSLIPDFLIGAHALVQADRLAVLDRGYLRRYFPELTLLGT
jgi:predicted nucleic acid-binding protein